MARDFFINGESMVSVKGNVNTAFPALTQLGLSDGPIRVSLEMAHEDIKVDAWGQMPPEIQYFLSAANVSMTLVHFDRTLLDNVFLESMAGAPAIGQLPRAGSRMGNNVPRFAANNHFIGLNILSPVAAKPWRFWFSYLAGNPFETPLGTERSVISLNFRVVPYTQDPWGNGTGAQGTQLWDYNLDT